MTAAEELEGDCSGTRAQLGEQAGTDHSPHPSPHSRARATTAITRITGPAVSGMGDLVHEQIHGVA